MNLEIFSKRLKELMEMEGESNRSLSIKINVDRTCIRYWLNGVYYPKYPALIKLSTFFNVSVDYLVGLEDAMDSVPAFQLSQEMSAMEISENLRGKVTTYMKEKNLTYYAMSKALNIDQTTFTKWFQNVSIPEVGTLLKLSRVMKVSLYALLGGK